MARHLWYRTIGQQLSGDELHMKRPVPTSIEPPPSAITAGLSNDKRILREYLLGVSLGEVVEEFVYKKPRLVSHARWLTTASRILMLYTRTEEPSDVLRLLVLYIQRIYGKVWFQVKRETSFTKGPSFLFGIIQEAKSFEKAASLRLYSLSKRGMALPVLVRTSLPACCTLIKTTTEKELCKRSSPSELSPRQTLEVVDVFLNRTSMLVTGVS
jgi:hypothetical protein